MRELALILLGTALVNNVVLAQLLGVSALARWTGRVEGALLLGTATLTLLVLSSSGLYLIRRWALEPLGIPQLFLPVAMLWIVLTAAVVELAGKELDARLYRALRNFRPWILANTAVLGTALLNADRAASLAAATFQAFAVGMGFLLFSALFAGLRERLDVIAVPQAFVGAPIQLISAGLMALAFMGFARMI